MKTVKQRAHQAIVDQKCEYQHFYSKNGEKEEKKLPRTAINNKSKETRHQRNNIATTNNKKQWMNYENRLYRRDKNKHLTRNT